jgi:hypothetical protein
MESLCDTFVQSGGWDASVNLGPKGSRRGPAEPGLDHGHGADHGHGGADHGHGGAEHARPAGRIEDGDDPAWYDGMLRFLGIREEAEAEEPAPAGGTPRTDRPDPETPAAPARRTAAPTTPRPTTPSPTSPTTPAPTTPSPTTPAPTTPAPTAPVLFTDDVDCSPGVPGSAAGGRPYLPRKRTVCLDPRSTEPSDPIYMGGELPPRDPYGDVSGEDFVTTFPENQQYHTCPFRAPLEHAPSWVDSCIANARRVGFLSEAKGRPNGECPAGWFLCRGLCYTLVQRDSRGPTRGRGYYAHDYMSLEARCGLCGKARVAFVNGTDMERVAAEAARQTINGDKAVWVRRNRFLGAPNPATESARGGGRGEAYQPWHRYVVAHEDTGGEGPWTGPTAPTYQRYYTGAKDGKAVPGWDPERNQEGSVLCVNTPDRIASAIAAGRVASMEEGCAGDDRHDMWDDRMHRWFPEDAWPYPLE